MKSIINSIEIEKSSKRLRSKGNPDIIIDTFYIRLPNDEMFNEKSFKVVYNHYKKLLGAEKLCVHVNTLDGNKTVKQWGQSSLHLYKIHEKFSTTKSIDRPENMFFSEILISVDNDFVKDFEDNLLLKKLN